MNTDCTKPSVAPKPRFVCHAKLKLPSPLMSAARGPKPSIAPKPRVTAELNGNQGAHINGSLLTSDSEADDELDIQNNANEVGAAGDFQVDKQSNVYVLRSDLQHVDQELTEEETPVGEEVVQRMEEEDGRSSDAGLTEEVDSILWASGGSEEAVEMVEMVETELTEDMDEDGCDAGEALADTDGLSVGDVSVNSTDGEAGCCSAENRHPSQKTKKMTVKIQIEEDEDKDDCTADDLTESITEEPVFITSKDAQAPLPDAEEEERGDNSASDFGFRCNKFGYAHKMKDKTQHLQNVHFYDFVPEVHKLVYDPANKHTAAEDDRTHEPYYISSEDIINRELMPRNNTGGIPESPLTAGKTKSSGISVGKHKETAENGQSSEDYVPIGNNGYSCHGGDKNKVRMFQKFPSVTTEETAEALLDHLDFQPRFRLVSISMPTDTDSSLTSSLSEIQLLSPNDSDLFRDDSDLDGDIVPFLEDTEHDVNDEPVYEEPRRSSESDNVFSCDRRSTETRSRSHLHRFKNNVSEMGSPFTPRSYVSGIGQPAPGGSPMLTMINRTYVKPQYLSLYPRSISMEGQDVPLGAYSLMEGYPRQSGGISSSGSFSRVSPLSSSGLSTPTSVVDIPPPFELAYITKRPITKSSPTLFVEGDSSEKNKKKKSSIKRFLLLKFGKRKTDSKPAAEVSQSASKPESGLHAPNRLLDLDQHSVSGSPQLNLRSVGKPHLSPEPAAKFLLYKDGKRKGSSVAFLNRSVVRVESFEDRSRVPFTSLPLTKPRSISFPNTDTSDYENVPAISSDYENLQIPQRRPVRQPPFPDFFDRPSRVLSSANETDGYVDMSSLPGFRSKTQTPEQETESAYTVCSAGASPQAVPAGDVRGATAGDEDQGRTSEEEDGAAESSYDRQPDGRSRAFYIAKELVDTERLHVRALKLLQEDFREAVGAAVGDEGEPVLNEERLREILNELPDVYTLHRRILNELENRIRHWEESQRIADVFLSRKSEFLVFTTYIGHYDRSMNLLEESCRASPAFANLVQQFEQQHPAGENVSLKHQLLQVIVRVAQYRMLLTDYLNNLSPDSKEYEDTQAAVAVVSDIADQANDSLKNGENLLRLVNIDYSVRGQRELLQPGRVFVKEGTLMKVSRRSRQPRHLFLTELLRAALPGRMFLNADFLSQSFTDSTGKMNDVLLYTYPQQDGKYRLKNTLPLSGLKVSKPIIENVQNPLRIEGTDISITLSASSFLEREDWFYTLNRTVNDQARCSASFNSCSGEARDRLHTLGEKAPTLVPVSQVMMCMNCTSDFSLTLRRHHCHGCGRIVCRSCSRNRYPLKYMKDRMAKVCDHCYSELKKRGGDVSAASAKSSPRLHRSSRPLSSVFQNIHPPNIWRHRKGTASFTQVTVSEEGSISGSLQRSQKTKRSWKRLWFHLKDKVLYTYRAQEEKVASESLPLLGFTVKLPDRVEEQEANIFQLYHKNTLYYTFKAVDGHTAQRWVDAMEEATVL